MKASELISALQEMVAEYGDHEAMYQTDGGVTDVKAVEYLQADTDILPPIFVIS